MKRSLDKRHVFRSPGAAGHCEVPNATKRRLAREARRRERAAALKDAREPDVVDTPRATCDCCDPPVTAR